MKKKRITYISGTRADFGLMLPVLNAIEKSPRLSLELFVTGEHLMPELGKTIDNVKKYFPKAVSIPVTIEGDSGASVAKFGADLFKKLVPVLEKSKPDLLLVLGDRIEMLVVATAGLYPGIPVAHIHGGEKTGTVDDVARQAITQLAHIHFVATKTAAARIKNMGKETLHIHVVGAPALDTILNDPLPTRKEVLEMLKLPHKSHHESNEEKFMLVVQHPVSEELEQADEQMRKTLVAVAQFKLPTVLIYPHADAGGRKIMREIEKEKHNPFVRIFKSLDHKMFLALEREASVIVGNSSAAIIEAASFGVPVVNIGDRQKGRDQSDNVVDVGYNTKEIARAIDKSLNDKTYRGRVARVKNVWGEGKAAKRIVSVLEKTLR